VGGRTALVIKSADHCEYADWRSVMRHDEIGMRAPTIKRQLYFACPPKAFA
jgi:hypothetical protein